MANFADQDRALGPAWGQRVSLFHLKGDPRWYEANEFSDILKSAGFVDNEPQEYMDLLLDKYYKVYSGKEVYS